MVYHPNKWTIIHARVQVLTNSKEIKSKAIALIKQAKEDKQIPNLASSVTFDNKSSGNKHNESWFYKIANGKIKPSLERSIDIIQHFEKDAA